MKIVEYLGRYHTEKKKGEGTSLVVQWLGLRLRMQGAHAGSVPGQGTKIPHASQTRKNKQTNMKQKQDSMKTLKMVHIKKIFKKKK